MILHGDLFDVLPTLEAERFDSCVTDPPYGIGFMGREWDTFKPEISEKLRARGEAWVKKRPDNPNLNGRKRQPGVSPSAVEYNRSLDGQRGFQEWTARWAAEVFRVLKPGAHLVVCGAPRSHHRMMCGLEDAGFEIRDCLAWLFGQGFPKSRNLGAGWGTALKPGHEPIALARKPFKGSITANHQQHGVGGLNVDGCRIDTDEVLSIGSGRINLAGGRGGVSGGAQHDLGRWPANVLLDEQAAEQLDAQSGESVSNGGLNPISNPHSIGTFEEKVQRPFFNYGDSGGASRFFYVAKPSREERDLGCDHLETRQRDESRKEGNPGGDNPRNRGLQQRGNFHPTVKPLALMRWLVRLVTPPGGIVLEPFGGSGTTAMACAAEGLDFVLIEREAEYVPIIEARLRSIAPLFTNVVNE